jgi:hypothetical protein
LPVDCWCSWRCSADPFVREGLPSSIHRRQHVRTFSMEAGRLNWTMDGHFVVENVRVCMLEY